MPSNLAKIMIARYSDSLLKPKAIFIPPPMIHRTICSSCYPQVQFRVSFFCDLRFLLILPTEQYNSNY
jgi:hypothetical protein